MARLRHRRREPRTKPTSEPTPEYRSCRAPSQEPRPDHLLHVAVDPDGISRASEALLADAKAKGVKVRSANLMVMYFGKKFINKGKSEGELGIDSAKKAYEQIQNIHPAIQIGLCPCLGNNGSKEEVFTLDDAKTLRAFADKTPWVCSLHYWSINGDSGRPSRRRPASTITSTNTAGVGTTNNSTTATVEIPRQPWAFANIFKSFTTEP